MSQSSRRPNRAVVGHSLSISTAIFWAFRLGRDSTRDWKTTKPIESTAGLTARCRLAEPNNPAHSLAISTLTDVVPCLTKSNFSATARDTSTIRFREVGPQSLTVASTLLPFFVFVILTLVPHGRLRCAVVSSDATYLPPQAVL
jgi:hypothetical protein